MSTQTGTITPIAEISLNKENASSVMVHGSIFYNGYIYGCPRTAGGSAVDGNNALCKVKKDNYNDYSAVAMKDIYGNNLYSANQIVACGDYLYANPFWPGTYGQIIRIDPDTLAHTLLSRTFTGDALASDGQYLYFEYGTQLWAWDPVTQTRIWYAQYPTEVTNRTGETAHSIVVDDNNVYVERASGPSGGTGTIVKVSKSNQSISYATICNCTDDATQSDNFVFCGVEAYQSGQVGYDWGALAIRKSDLEIFKLPKLHASDTAGTVSYASLRFGDYLVDVKTNNHLYVIDITHPENWTLQSDPNDFVLFDYEVQDSQTSAPHNELVMDTDGYFHEFTWDVSPNPAHLRKISIPGVSFLSAPELNTLNAAEITSVFATLRGYIITTGGREITANGFVWGTSSGNYDHTIHVPNVPVGNFSLLIENLTPGQTYYYKSFATNSIGTTYSDESVFTTQASATNPCLLGTVAKDSVVVEGATVFLVNVGSGQFVAKKNTNSNGRFAFTSLLVSSKYHVGVEYIDAQLNKWNTMSLPYLTPVLK